MTNNRWKTTIGNTPSVICHISPIPSPLFRNFLIIHLGTIGKIIFQTNDCCKKSIDYLRFNNDSEISSYYFFHNARSCYVYDYHYYYNPLRVVHFHIIPRANPLFLVKANTIYSSMLLFYQKTSNLILCAF